MLIRRINFYGGPCSGKSVAASYIFAKLKQKGYNIELIQEVAKEWVYEGKKITNYDQLSIFSNQLAREYRVLSSDEDIIIISDSPSMLSVPYMMKYGFRFCDEIIEITNGFELDYPSINFFLERKNCPFSNVGRFESYEESQIMDIKIRKFLIDQNISFIPVEYSDLSFIFRTILNFLESDQR